MNKKNFEQKNLREKEKKRRDEEKDQLFPYARLNCTGINQLSPHIL